MDPVNVAFDHCMETKAKHGQCLEDLPQASSIRSSQDDQTACIELEKTGTPTSHCKVWLGCMDPTAKANILRINKAFSQPLSKRRRRKSCCRGLKKRCRRCRRKNRRQKRRANML